MGATLHHLETMGIVYWYLQGIIIPGFLRWCEMDFVDPQYVPRNPISHGTASFRPGPAAGGRLASFDVSTSELCEDTPPIFSEAHAPEARRPGIQSFAPDR